MSHVLVAGSAGLLGSAVVEKVLAKGDTVVAVDFLEAPGSLDSKETRVERLRRLPRTTALRLLAHDLTQPDELFAGAPPDMVVNAARFARGTCGSLALIEAARRAGTSLFVHVSDSDLYGPSPEPGRRAGEDEPVSPGDDPTLRLREEEEEALRRSGMPFAILRCFELLSPSLPSTRFPIGALEALLSGDPIPEPDDLPRDFLHVDDAAEGVVLALERPPLGEVVNLGSGVGTSPRGVLGGLAAAAGLTPRFQGTAPAPAREPRIADVERSWQRLGFAPRHSIGGMLDEILRSRLSTIAAPEPRPQPRQVSRRHLFDMFRRPFGGGG